MTSEPSATSVQCTVRRCRDGAIRETQRDDVSIFSVEGSYSGGLLQALERTLKRCRDDVGLDLRELLNPGPRLVPLLKRLNRHFAEKQKVFLLYEPPSRVLDLLELDGCAEDFNTYRADAGLQVMRSPEQKLEEAVAETSSLTQSVVKLEKSLARAETLESSLDNARRFTLRSLCRPVPCFAPFQLSAAYLPHDKLGGDFFAALPLDEDHLGIAIGDVAGHGLDAAILMGMARKVMEIRASEGPVDDPAEVLRRVNRDISPELDRYKFITALYGILQRSTGNFVFARAGHTLPLHIRRQPREVVPVSCSGMALGLDAGPLFDSNAAVNELRLDPGDSLLLYTDGLTEAEHPRRGQYGIERLLETLLTAPCPTTADALRDCVVTDVKSFLDGCPLGDDLTLLGVTYLRRRRAATAKNDG